MIYKLTANILYDACMMSPALDNEFTDAEILKWVTAFQIESKMCYARCGIKFVQNYINNVDLCVQRTVFFLNEGLVPLAVIVDQIGWFFISKQVFVPVFNNVSDFSYELLQDFTILTLLGHLSLH